VNKLSIAAHWLLYSGTNTYSSHCVDTTNCWHRLHSNNTSTLGM